MNIPFTLFLLQGLCVIINAITCVSPIVYTSNTPYACTDPVNYIKATDIPNFPLGASAMTFVAYIYINSVSGTGCISNQDLEVFAVTNLLE